MFLLPLPRRDFKTCSLRKSSTGQTVTMGSHNRPGHVASPDLNILLVGPRRTGKSSTGNTLLGRWPVFETRGGGASTIASAITAGWHMSVVDAQGWGLSEEFVPEEEKSELLRAVSLFGPGGPHAVLLVVPLDFTKAEGRAVERRMEILTSEVWRHTVVVFTCGDRIRRSGRSVEERVQSGGPALHWLMEMCRHRYHVFDNKAAAVGRQDGKQQEAKGEGRKQGGNWQKKGDRAVGRKKTGGEAGKQGEQEQVRELLSKVENMLLENRGWHFSLHMYQRMEKEWSHREQQLRARLEAKINMEREQRLETEEEEEEELRDSPRRERGERDKCVERKMNRREDEGQRGEFVEMKRLSREEDGWALRVEESGRRTLKG